MYYLINWKKRTVVYQHETEEKLRRIRRNLVKMGEVEEYDLVIAQGVE